MIPNAFGEYLTPSVVSIDEDGTVYVGKTAKERLASHPEETVCPPILMIWQEGNKAGRKISWA